MFCVQCGKKVSEDIKYCPNCGTSISTPKSNSSDINLLKGFEPKSELFKSFLKSYQDRNDQSGFIANNMPKATRDFIVTLDFKECINLPLDEGILSKLSEKMLQRFMKEAIPKIDSIAADLLVTGYILRSHCKHLNSQTDFEELKKFDDPKEVVEYLLTVDSSMHTFGSEDKGFELSPLVTGIAGESVLESVEQNIALQYPPAKALTKAALIILLNLGWHLCRYDMSKVRNR